MIRRRQLLFNRILFIKNSNHCSTPTHLTDLSYMANYNELKDISQGSTEGEDEDDHITSCETYSTTPSHPIVIILIPPI